MKDSIAPCDIFGISMHVTQSLREKEFSEVFAKLSRFNLLKPSVHPARLRQFVSIGLLSPQSASYFLSGRASYSCTETLKYYIKMYDSPDSAIELTKLLASWQKDIPAVPESILRFPLVELDSSDSGFEDLRSRYEDVDYCDLQKL